MKLNYGIIGTGMMGCEHIRNLKKNKNNTQNKRKYHDTKMM